MRVISNSYVEERERNPDSILPFPQQMSESTRTGVFGFGRDEHVDIERTCLPSGQGVGGIDDIVPAGEIVRRVVEEAKSTIERIGALASGAASGSGDAASRSGDAASAK